MYVHMHIYIDIYKHIYKFVCINKMRAIIKGSRFIRNQIFNLSASERGKFWQGISDPMGVLYFTWYASLLQTPHPLGFNDNIYHEGYISRLPDFDGFFSLLDIRKHNKRPHGKHKNRNLKRKNKHVLTLSELSISLKHSGRHMVLSRLIILSISSLRNLDIEANTFYDRAHRLYGAALLTRCYTQHALQPYYRLRSKTH